MTRGPNGHDVRDLYPSSDLDAVGYEGFEIRASERGGEKTALVLPDIATCPDCLREIFAPDNRRHLYPFTNCRRCKATGKRRSIFGGRGFALCSRCDGTGRQLRPGRHVLNYLRELHDKAER